MKKLIKIIAISAIGNCVMQHASAQTQTPWNLTGNSNTSGNNFLGTTDYQPLILKTNASEHFRITPDGETVLGVPLTPGTPLVPFTGSTGSGLATSKLTMTSDNPFIFVGQSTHKNARVYLQSLSKDPSADVAFGTVDKKGISTSALLWYNIDSIAHTSDFSIVTRGGGRALTILNSGNVGIGAGAAVPTAQLHTTGTVRFQGLQLSAATDNTMVVTDANGNLFKQNIPNSGLTSTCSDVNFLPKTSGAGTLACSQVYDDGTGVGIGTKVPFSNTAGSSILTTNTASPFVFIGQSSNTNTRMYLQSLSKNAGADVAFGTLDKKGLSTTAFSWYNIDTTAHTSDLAIVTRGGGHAVTVLNGGNVGIGAGASVPTAQLHTTGTVRFQGLQASTATGNTMVVADVDGNLFKQNIPNNGLTSTCTDVNMLPKTTGSGTLGCSQVYDNGTGVGIGTKTPFSNTAGSSILTTNTATPFVFIGQSSNTNTRMYLQSLSKNAAADVAFGALDRKGLSTTAFSWNNIDTIAHTADLSIVTRGKGPAVTVLNGGNVGVGTNAPTAQLHTTGSVRLQGLTNNTLANRLVVADANGNVSTQNIPANGFVSSNCASANFIPKMTNGNTMSCSQIYDNGTNVIVGAPFTPSNYLGINWKFEVNGTAHVTGLFLSSDARYKKNIKAIESPLSKVLKLNGKTYNWKKEEFADKNFDDKKQLGFIAQELEKVLPEAVIKDEAGYYSVNYIAVIPLLTEAMKEQQQIIDEQKSQLDDVQNKLADIQKQLALLAAKKVNDDSDNHPQPGNTLNQNVPNPFDNFTTIGYNLQKSGKVELTVYSMNGQEVAKLVDKNQENGMQNVTWDASSVPSGIYTYVLKVNGEEISKKAIVKK